MSDTTVKDKLVKGKMRGFTKPINPFKKEVMVHIDLDGKVIDVTIDYRQLRFIMKEYPVNSFVPMKFSGDRWHIMSRTIQEPIRFTDGKSVYI